jgi:hypothetical protein
LQRSRFVRLKLNVIVAEGTPAIMAANQGTSKAGLDGEQQLVDTSTSHVGFRCIIRHRNE